MYPHYHNCFTFVKLLPFVRCEPVMRSLVKRSQLHEERNSSERGAGVLELHEFSGSHICPLEQSTCCFRHERIKEWSEFLFISIEVVEAPRPLNTQNDNDYDKLRQQRNWSIQSKCCENNGKQVND